MCIYIHTHTRTHIYIYIYVCACFELPPPAVRPSPCSVAPLGPLELVPPREVVVEMRGGAARLVIVELAERGP